MLPLNSFSGELAGMSGTDDVMGKSVQTGESTDIDISVEVEMKQQDTKQKREKRQTAGLCRNTD